jgi:hypothetical protein
MSASLTENGAYADVLFFSSWNEDAKEYKVMEPLATAPKDESIDDPFIVRRMLGMSFHVTP